MVADSRTRYQVLLAGIERDIERREERQEANRLVRERRVTPKAHRPRCGARCRDGHLCQARPVWDREHDRPRNGRCRVHGGLSTGPRTPEGRAKVAALARQRAAARALARPAKPAREPGRRCQGMCVNGEPCSAWAVPGNEEPLCAAHRHPRPPARPDYDEAWRDRYPWLAR